MRYSRNKFQFVVLAFNLHISINWQRRKAYYFGFDWTYFFLCFNNPKSLWISKRGAIHYPLKDVRQWIAHNGGGRRVELNDSSESIWIWRWWMDAGQRHDSKYVATKAITGCQRTMRTGLMAISHFPGETMLGTNTFSRGGWSFLIFKGWKS